MRDHEDTDNLDSIDLDGLHVRLAERLTEVVGTAREADVALDVEIDAHYCEQGLTSVSVTPNEDWTQAGQKGFDSYHLILGPGGAAKNVRKSSALGETKEYTHHQFGGSPNRMWRIAVVGGIERMA
jgi:hypothetical protein